MNELRNSGYFQEARKIVPDVMGVCTGFGLLFLMFFLGKFLVEAPDIKLADIIQLAILVFIAGTMGVGIWVQRSNGRFARSRIFLEHALSLVDKAKKVLTMPDGSVSNDRISWVTAARLISRAEEIREQITEEPHKAVFAAEHDYHRHCFGDFFKFRDRPLTASFFCGAHDPSVPVGEAVCDSSQGKDGRDWIPTRIISVVYRFFQYPDGYEDPLDRSRNLTGHELHRLWLFEQRGVCDYFTFRKNFVAISSSVRRLQPGRVQESVGAAEINAEMRNLSGILESED